MRQNWTDSRMDDLKDQVGRLDSKFDRLDARMDRLDAKVDAGFARLDTKIDRTSEMQALRIDALSETILTATGRLFGACIAVVIAIVGLIATQL